MNKRNESATIDGFAPFVIVGSSKSGTTWLQKMLDLHPEIRCHFQRPIFPLKRRDLFFPARVTLKTNTSPYGGLFREASEERQYQTTLAYVNSLDFLDGMYLGRLRIPDGVEKEVTVRRLHRKVRAAVVLSLIHI